jgi:lysozyme
MVEKYYGRKPLIYTSNTFYNKYLANKYSEYKIFIGRYSSKQPNLKDDRNWCIWQFSKKGSVNGIGKNVDINKLHAEYNLQDLMID